ncbi:Riboflavin biosynthesis protein RibBA [Smittium mucronatum]|uniref:3,4-dihydroxy-2-butanone 4-phosphate synthase n=1 Tax=Smittium mucronatum TaxID=133383 RepID=A0A1R0H9L0_9FUNG|nr:Riboflavin biosynthesis protein RibBA [Smittium mucronatum]
MFIFNTIDQAIEDIKLGKPVVVVDNEDRENEGDIIFAAEHATTELMAFTIRYTSGFICCSLEPSRLQKLELPLMVVNNTDPKKTQYSITVDSATNTTTGISAHDRSVTVKLLANPKATAGDFYRPGHVVPLFANPKGILGRQGHTEAAIELCKLAGCFPAGVLCELVNDDGTMKRRNDCREFADKHDLKLISIENLIEYITSKNSSTKSS